MKFDIYKEVPNLELCKKLKELGFPQEGGGWYWRELYELDECRKEPMSIWRLMFLKKVIIAEDGEVYVSTDVYPSPFDEMNIKAKPIIKAPTVSELGEWLPTKIEVKGEIYRLEITAIEGNAVKYFVSYYCSKTDEEIEEFDLTEANARAKMLIWLIENGYVSTH